MMDPHRQNEFEKSRRLLIVYIWIALAIQIIILLAYYFKEKQTLLAFPMLLGIFVTAACLPLIKQLKG